MSRATIADVAKVAGVSKSTVSRVLSGRDEYMKQETRARVEQAIAGLGYRPSSVARSLVSRLTYSVGLLVSDVGNPFYPEVIHGVEAVAFAHGYDMFLCNTNYDLERGMKFVRSLIDKQVDGVLIMSSTMSDAWVLELSENNVPVVVIDWQMKGVTDGAIGTLNVDYQPGIREMVDHLVGLGHRQIAHVSGPLRLRTAQLRRDAFFDALVANDLNPQNALLIEGDFRIEGGRQALAQLLAQEAPPTAIFAANDLMAMGIVRSARTHNLSVPGDLSVVGLDDIWLVRDMDPPLTTVALPRYELGSEAMKMLINLLQAASEENSKPVKKIETHLVKRQSTGVPI